MTGTYIDGIGITKMGKREEGLVPLLAEAGRRALDACGDRRPDALYVGCFEPGGFEGIGNLPSKVATELGLAGIPLVRIENSTASGASVFMHACIGVRSGTFQNVLAIAGERMTGLDAKGAARVLTSILTPEEVRTGVSMPGMAAMVTRRYMHLHGLTEEVLALVPVKAHANGALNPIAQFQKPITVEQVFASKMVASPLRLYHCAPLTDGAAAAMVTSRSGPVQVKGFGNVSDIVDVKFKERLDAFGVTIETAKMAFKMAGLGPKDIDVAELHDAFSVLEIIHSEDVGFFKKGEGWKALKKGETQLNGSIPINTSGGLKARGHPIGGTGLAQICEVFTQLTGQAGKRQVDPHRRGFTLNLGGFATNNVAHIFEAR